MNALSKKLVELRTKKGLSVRALAEKIGKSAGYISRIEGRGEIPSADLLCQLAELFGVKPESLLDLAKRSQLEQAEKDIDDRQKFALELFRKEKK